MASTQSRLMALGFDLLVMLFLLIAVYLMGLKFIDQKFPGERSHRADLIALEKKSIVKIDAEQKKAAAADKQAAAAKTRKDTAGVTKAKAAAASARASAAKETKRRGQLDAQVTKIDRRINPWFYPVVIVAILLLLAYLVPSTARSGQTMGKRLRRIRVVRLDGSRPGWSTALLRYGAPLLVGILLSALLRTPLGLVVALLGIIGWISNPNRQGLHDRLAKTIVVEA
jgi:hypothetical protein